MVQSKKNEGRIKIEKFKKGLTGTFCGYIMGVQGQKTKVKWTCKDITGEANPQKYALRQDRQRSRQLESVWTVNKFFGQSAF